MTSMRILLVEDNPADVLLVEITLDELGWSPLLKHVARVQGALDLLAGDEFDVVLLDLNLPDGQGLSNFRRINEASPQTPVILLTGLADEAVALQAIQLGAADYLIKGATDAPLLERSMRYATERKKNENARVELARARIARAEAEAANRAKDEFLATLSHELRTPLNAILGWASLLRTGQLNSVEIAQALETIERNARVQAQLIEDLLDVSRIVAGNLKLQWTVLDPREIIQAAVDATRPMVDDKNIAIHLHLKPVPAFEGDATRLQQVLWNLIANAAKFTPVNGNIWIELDSKADDQVGLLTVITVRDDGQGIDPEFLPAVFDRFRQADSSSTRRHGGLGLGLSIVRHLVEMHGGRVRAQSHGAGQGSSFVIELPPSPAAGKPRLRLDPDPPEIQVTATESGEASGEGDHTGSLLHSRMHAI